MQGAAADDALVSHAWNEELEGLQACGWETELERRSQREQDFAQDQELCERQSIAARP